MKYVRILPSEVRHLMESFTGLKCLCVASFYHSFLFNLFPTLNNSYLGFRMDDTQADANKLLLGKENYWS
jgi:hypothetical protein